MEDFKEWLVAIISALATVILMIYASLLLGGPKLANRFANAVYKGSTKIAWNTLWLPFRMLFRTLKFKKKGKKKKKS
jgi:hypothetical protein